jgi:hypothetical protein
MEADEHLGIPREADAKVMLSNNIVLQLHGMKLLNEHNLSLVTSMLRDQVSDRLVDHWTGSASRDRSFDEFQQSVPFLEAMYRLITAELLAEVWTNHAEK